MVMYGHNRHYEKEKQRQQYDITALPHRGVIPALP